MPITQRKSGKASALRCAAQGWRVLPLHRAENGNCACARGEACPHPGKHPRTLHGVKDATTDRKQIKAWWEKWPKANVGIATGAPSGIFVLDVDGAAGKASLKELEAEHGRLPRTVTVKTGNGRHLYFRSAGGRVGNSAGRLGQGNRCPRRWRLRRRRRERPLLRGRLPVRRRPGIGGDRSSFRPRVADRPDLRTQGHRRRRRRTQRSSSSRRQA
jgi:hypothetical protein